MSILDDLYAGVAHAVVGIHTALEPVFGRTNGYGWALSIVLLTMAVRLLLFPLFVKQIKSQRTLQMLQPKMKEIREKHKNDKQRMNEELMKLQKEHGNPLLGCLPIFAQIPLFIALFRVLNGFAPKLRDGKYVFLPSHGLDAETVRTVGTAKIFGVPLSATFQSPRAVLDVLGAHSLTGVRIVAIALIITMCTTTFLTQKQVMGRNGPVDPAQRTQQRVFLYLAPLMLGGSGFFFPIGVLIYWMTTNGWSMGQQFFVLRKMPPVIAPVATTGAARVPEHLRPADKGGPAGKGGAGVPLTKGPRPGKGPRGRAEQARAAEQAALAEAAQVRLRQSRRSGAGSGLAGAAPAAAGPLPVGGADGAAEGSAANAAAGGTPALSGGARRAPQRPQVKRKPKNRRGGRR